MAKKDMTMGIIAHISGILVGFLGPLIFYLAVDDAANKEQAKHALNWQISLLIYLVVASISMVVLLGFILLPALGVLNTIFCIIGAIKASKGEDWKYPMTIQFLK